MNHSMMKTMRIAKIYCSFRFWVNNTYGARQDSCLDFSSREFWILSPMEKVASVTREDDDKIESIKNLEEKFVNRKRHVKFARYTQGLQSGEVALFIGTHSLKTEKVEFSSLQIVVVDEQHRFGVIQRGRFYSKLYTNSVTSRLTEIDPSGISKDDINMAPHDLAMTATPITRTLALALYGAMSLTQITDLPPGRKPIDTFIFLGNGTGFEEVYQMMNEELDWLKTTILSSHCQFHP